LRADLLVADSKHSRQHQPRTKPAKQRWRCKSQLGVRPEERGEVARLGRKKDSGAQRVVL